MRDGQAGIAREGMEAQFPEYCAYEYLPAAIPVT
jgi:hypothetical protein